MRGYPAYFTVCGMRFLQRVLFAVLLGALVVAGAAGCSADTDSTGSGVALPKDFPASDVPMIDGTRLAVDAGDGTWQVKVQAPPRDGDGFTNAVDKLKESGYVESSRTDTDREKSVLLYRETGGRTLWVTVGISGSAAGGASTVIYSVTRL